MAPTHVRPNLQPVVKWVGGKRQLLTEIAPLMPLRYNRYCEPFLGGAAVMLYLQPSNALVGDLNGELILLYEVIRDNVEDLIDCLNKHINTKEHYYAVRNIDRDREEFLKLNRVQRAARLAYLNRTCFNGLFRVNSRGHFNTPFGSYNNPCIVNPDNLRGVSRYFNENDIEFMHGDFQKLLERLGPGDFVYLDPPYDPVSETSAFVSYNSGGFGQYEQMRLKECLDAITDKGVLFMMSNSSTPFINKLFEEYDITVVKARRAINANANCRGHVDEVVIRNYTTRPAY